MNRLLLTCVNLLPEALVTRFVSFYFDRQMKKHVKLDVKGLNHLDSAFKRPYLFVCNHLSNSDGLVLNKVLEKEDITFVAGKKLKANAMTNLGFKIVKSISITPNSPDKEAIKRVIKTVKEGNSILVFPEGTRSRTAKMLEGKKGILLFANMTKAPIVPVAIWGSEQFMPIKKDMGEEVFCDADIHIRVGEVFQMPVKTEGKSKGEWEDMCLNHIMQSIAELLPEEYRGVYL